MSQVKKDQPVHYGCVPRIIASDARHHDLSPAELAIMAALLSLAHIATREDNFSRAMAHGKRPMTVARSIHDDFVEGWEDKRRAAKFGTNLPAPKKIDVHNIERETYKGGNIGADLRKVGKKGFAEGLKLARERRRPEGILFSISRKQLLRCAHLPRDGRTVLVLMRALEKFSAPMRVDEREMPPLLMFEASPDGLGIIVAGAWLQKQYVRMPMPLPIRSAPATAMLLFVKSLPPKALHNGGVSTITNLAARIGLGQLSRSQARRGLNRALDVLNDRLRKISDATAEACEKAGFKVPGAFKFEFVGKHQMRLVSKRRQVRDASPEGRGVTWRSQRKVARVRVTAAQNAAYDAWQAKKAERETQEHAAWRSERLKSEKRAAFDARRSATISMLQRAHEDVE